MNIAKMLQELKKQNAKGLYSIQKQNEICMESCVH